MRVRLLVAACCATSAMVAFPVSAAATGCADLPAHTAIPVVDSAHAVPPDREAYLAADLMAYHLTGHEAIVAATVTTLGGDDVASYAKRLFDCWSIGDKGSDNGVLILVAMREHRTRIELGAGLESRVTEEQLDLAVEAMTSPLRAGDVAGGLRAAAVALADDLGAPLPDTAALGAGATPSDGADVTDGGDLALPTDVTAPGVGFDPYGTSESPGGAFGGLFVLAFLLAIAAVVVRFVLHGVGVADGQWRTGGFFGSSVGNRGYWSTPSVFHEGSWRDSGQDGGGGSMSSGPSGGSSFGGGSSGGGGASGSW